jgi:pyruvate dehydrogenase E1 component alpha subunit
MVMEAFNLAMVWHLPVVFVCKDNRWSIFSRSADMTGGDPVTRAASFGLAVSRVDGADVGAVWHQAGAAISAARRGEGPQFLLATCRRPRGHFEDDPLVRRARQVKAGSADLPGLGRAVIKRRGGSIRARVRGLGEVVGTLGRASLHFRGSREDPLPRARRVLDPVEADRVESEARAEVTAAVQQALAGRP